MRREEGGSRENTTSIFRSDFSHSMAVLEDIQFNTAPQTQSSTDSTFKTLYFHRGNLVAPFKISSPDGTKKRESWRPWELFSGSLTLCLPPVPSHRPIPSRPSRLFERRFCHRFPNISNSLEKVAKFRKHFRISSVSSFYLISAKVTTQCIYFASIVEVKEE